MKIIVLAVLSLLCASSLAGVPKKDWQVGSGKLTYHVNFPLKSIEGVSTNVKGKGVCDEKQCQFLIAAPVKSFESGDGNRDNHMLEVTHAATHPMVLVKVSFPTTASAPKIEASAEVSFAGKTHTYSKVTVATMFETGKAITRGTLPLALSDFQVERPSLLTVKIDDQVPIDFDLTWQ